MWERPPAVRNPYVRGGTGISYKGRVSSIQAKQGVVVHCKKAQGGSSVLHRPCSEQLGAWQPRSSAMMREIITEQLEGV